MGDSRGQYQKLPPGWDCRYDQSTGNCYYINYLTRAIQLEDPRANLRYKALQNERCSTESIPMQPLHGGSPYHVYPINNLPAVRAFQAGPALNPSLHMSQSPLLSSSRGQLELSPIPFLKSSAMQTPRMMANMSRRSTIQETSFTNPIDTDAVVAKIQNMFPTASENHIRLLLRRYYNREAVVISALQVEKHPVTMPGPYVTPPAQRHLFHSNSAFYMTPPARRLDIGAAATTSRVSSGLGFNSSRTASPIPSGRFGSVMSMQSANFSGVRGVDDGVGFSYTPLPYHGGSPRFGDQWRSSPKPHSSPKMKLRYMKNIFPKADEMLLLDILADADNNVQIASEKLISMGYVKRDFIPHVHRPTTAEVLLAQKKADDEKLIPLRPKEYTHEEKEAMQKRLKEKYSQIAERIILMALESVNYAEERAIQILQIVQEEDETRAVKHAVASVAAATSAELQTTYEQDESLVEDAQARETNNIITVVVETLPDQSNEMNHNNNMLKEHAAAAVETATTKFSTKKHKFPSINVTTPTTATTQIILSNSVYSIENESEPPPHPHPTTTATITATKTATDAVDASAAAAAAAATKANTSSSSTSTPSESCEFPSASSLTTSSSTAYEKLTTKNILARSNSNSIGIKGYLHGSTSYNSTSILDKLKLSRSRDKSDSLKHTKSCSTDGDYEHLQQNEFKSIMGRIAVMGHDNKLAKGPDENLLLADYVTWNGANPDISLGHRQMAVGSDASLLGDRSYTAKGRNPELCKGAKASLAKSSIYAQLTAGGGSKSTNIKCN